MWVSNIKIYKELIFKTWCKTNFDNCSFKTLIIKLHLKINRLYKSRCMLWKHIFLLHITFRLYWSVFFLFSINHQILSLVATFRNSIYIWYACVIIQLLIFWLEFCRIAFRNKSDSMASIREIKRPELPKFFHQNCTFVHKLTFIYSIPYLQLHQSVRTKLFRSFSI